MKVSGHKSETSLKSYSHFISNGKKRKISEILINTFGQQPSKTENEIGTENLSDLASVFADDFELELLDALRSVIHFDMGPA